MSNLIRIKENHGLLSIRPQDMSMLLFYVGDNRYAIDNRHVIQIVPRVLLKKIPNTPHFVAGSINFRGQFLPVIDFCQLIEQRNTQASLSSRIILLKESSSDNLPPLAGLLGEKVSEIIDLETDQFGKNEFYFLNLPYFDKSYSDDHGIILNVNIVEFFHFLRQSSI